MKITDKVNEFSYVESLTIGKYTVELRLVFAGELYAVKNVVSRDSANMCRINLREYMRDKCLHELYEHTPKCSHKFIQEQSKIIFQ